LEKNSDTLTAHKQTIDELRRNL